VSGSERDGRSRWRRVSPAVIALAVLAVGLGLTLHQLGNHPLVDFDEAINAVIIRHMGQSGNWLVPVYNGSAHLRRPPLYFWAAALVAGGLHQYSAFAYRLPAAITAAVLGAGLAVTLPRQFRWPSWVGGVAGLALLTMPYFLILSREAMLSGPAAALVAAAVLSGWAMTRGRGGWPVVLAVGAFLGLLVLEDSATALVPLAVLAVDAGARRRRPGFTRGQLAGALLVAAAIGGFWPILMASRYGPGFWDQYLAQNVVARVGSGTESGARPVYYYLPLLAAGLGAFGPPLAVCLVGSWRRAWRSPDSAERLALIWLVVAVVGFSAAVTKLPWYTAPVYPAMALLLASPLGRLPEWRSAKTWRPGWVAAALGSVVAGLALALWSSPHPVVALGVCALAGAAAAVVDLWPSLRRLAPSLPVLSRRPVSARPWLLGLLVVAAVVPIGRAAIFPYTPGAPGLAQSLQPEPTAVPEAAIGSLAATDRRVPLGLLVGATPTMVYYSDRNRVAIYTALVAAAMRRHSWLITLAGLVPQLRREAPRLRVLGHRGHLVLVALAGYPVLAR
jgi:4-amino-4-deoxy-L-arabinose transferase-like glycosyltransferase